MSLFSREDQQRRLPQGLTDQQPVVSGYSGTENPPPKLPPDSPGSSVSTRLQEEYDELLKYAVVVQYDTKQNPSTSRLADSRGPFDKKEDIVTLRASTPPAGMMRDLDRVAQVLEPSSQLQGMDGEQQRDARDMRHLPDFGASSPIATPRDQNDSFSQDKTEEPQLLPMFRNKSRKSSSRVGYSQGGCEGSAMSPINLSMRSDASFDMSHGGGIGGGVGVGSGDGSGDGSCEFEEKVYTTTIDPDLDKMEAMLDQWCLDLKRNVMAEFSQSKAVIEQRCRKELRREATRHSKEKTSLLKDLDAMKEYIDRYDKRAQKNDSVVSNLTEALYRQRDKLNLLKNFSLWRSMHADTKREQFTTKLARLHYERVLKRRVIRHWFSVIAKQWKKVVEKACQTKAEAVLRDVTAQYEKKINDMKKEKEAHTQEIQQLHMQRETCEEAMKKAFMRGVCALNMEAMSIFHQEDNRPDPAEPASPSFPAPPMEEVVHSRSSDNLNFFLPEGVTASSSSSSHTKHVPAQNRNQNNIMPCSSVAFTDDLQPSPQSHPRVVTSRLSRSMPGGSAVAYRQSSGRPSSSAATAPKGKVVIAKMTGNKGGDCGRAGVGRSSSPLHAPVASVVVERHQPVTKQTIGQATAAKLTRPAEADKFRKLAGQQSGAKPIHTVRVVD